MLQFSVRGGDGAAPPFQVARTGPGRTATGVYSWTETNHNLAQMGDARIHHYLPQCYLKGFTRDGSKDSHLVGINLHGGSTFETRPRNVGAIRDFNRLDGFPPGALEQELAVFEAEVDAALIRIGKARSIANSNDWNAVLSLMALFAIRNPRQRETNTDFLDRVARKIMSVALATPERWESQVKQMAAAGALKDAPEVSYEEMKEFHERGEYDISVATGWHIMTEFKTMGPVLQTMGARSWFLGIAGAESGGFVTTDHPVCLMHNDAEPLSPNRPVGHGLANTTLIFPINWELLAVGTFEGSAGAAELTPLQVATMNSAICFFARRQIYARDLDFKFFGEDDRETISGAELADRIAKADGVYPR